MRQVAIGILLLLLMSSCTSGPAPAEGPLPFNFHAVDPGRFYRSAQPTPDELANVIQHFGIKTILNLRGTNEGVGWYEDERAVAEAMGVTLLDQKMSAHALPSGQRLAAIQDVLKNGEYPILVHCQGGSDRTGAISAIYRMVILGHDRADALDELSILVLHFPWYAPCMDLLARIYEPTADWLAEYSATYMDLTCEP